MTPGEPLAEIWRGEVLESLHTGHAVICDGAGDIVESWGNPGQLIYPRSSCKMVQALPLVETEAGARLSQERLSLACASHSGAAIHSGRVRAWLEDLGLSEADLRCGPQRPDDREAREAMRNASAAPSQLHNNCSGKHAGFLMLSQHLGGGPDYVDPQHPVQKGARAAFEDVTGETSPAFGIDGCSAPNFACTVHGLARGMAFFATAHRRSGLRDRAAARLVEAMRAHPDLVAGEGRACTELMRAMEGRAAIKTGAEGVYVAILPNKGLGIALKVADGATRGSECAIAALLARLGILERDHPLARKRAFAPILNRRGIVTGEIRPAPALLGQPERANSR